MLDSLLGTNTVVKTEPPTLPHLEGFDVLHDETVFDNNHAFAPVKLNIMVGKPFLELRRRTWLTVRLDYDDVQKLLHDAFRLFRGDNPQCNAGDAAGLPMWVKRAGSNTERQWEGFIKLCLEKDLLPFKDGSAPAKELLKAVPAANMLGMVAIVDRYKDVRMPLQMRIFAEQVIGSELKHTINEELWADLLKFEEWEWTRHGFDWKTIFKQDPKNEKLRTQRQH
jgi:hypothetical protein